MQRVWGIEATLGKFALQKVLQFKAEYLTNCLTRSSAPWWSRQRCSECQHSGVRHGDVRNRERSCHGGVGAMAEPHSLGVSDPDESCEVLCVRIHEEPELLLLPCQTAISDEAGLIAGVDGKIALGRGETSPLGKWVSGRDAS